MKAVPLLLLLCFAAPAKAQEPTAAALRLLPDSVTAGPGDQLRRATYSRPLKPAAGYDYYQNLGAACKAEWKLERATGIPLRLRLGSLQQTEYLEQKPNALKPEQR